MPTLNDLIEYTRHSMSGFESGTETVSALASPISPSDTSLALTDLEFDAQGGVVEVGWEVMRLKKVDSQNRQLVVWPFGRGYRGTTATAHSAGSEVKFNPTWPASTIAREINGVLTEIYPQIYVVASSETTVPDDRGPLTVPVGAVGVIGVWVKDQLGNWFRESRWNWRPDSTSGQDKLVIGGQYEPGRSVRIVYAKRPGLFDLTGSPTQDFATVTGLDSRLADLVRLGIAVRMAPLIDVSRLGQVASAARDDGADVKPPNAGANAARLLVALFRQRLDAESAVLAKEHPITVHFTGVS